VYQMPRFPDLLIVLLLNNYECKIYSMPIYWNRDVGCV